MVKNLHNSLCAKSRNYLEQLPADRLATEDELTSALEGVRCHTANSELYFWEHSYKLNQLKEKIPIDTDGKAHIFAPVVTKTSPATTNQEATTETTKQHTSTTHWQCHPELCLVQPELIDGVVTLLRRIVTTKAASIKSFYLSLDVCNNPSHKDLLGHPTHCELGVTCHSLLRPARILACHYPVLRSLVYRLYEVRRLTAAVHCVQTAMADGNYDTLKDAITNLEKFPLQSACKDSNKVQEKCTDSTVDEATVMAKFGMALRDVADMRDTYVTTVCDVCEQLRKDVSTLKAYECRKGFTSPKMTQLIELLYQMKTEHEDIDAFLESVYICKYCADKVISNKDIARCAFNHLLVIQTPECIQELNVFERSLIKFYLNCITVIRLGQVSNTARPQSELNAALKGRIAYLPLDVKATANFVPHDVLNTDGLVLLVAGQPTKSKKVWTSVVDLRKVQNALVWLKDNNKFYKDIPAYSISEMESIIQERLASSGEFCDEHDNALLKKLSDAAKTHLL